MKYIIDLPDKDIDKYKLGNGEMAIPVRIGMSDFRIGIGTGINLTPYDESEAEQRGADKAWKLACHLYNLSPDVTEAIYWSMNGGKGLGVALEMSYTEAQAEYEAWKKRKDEIKIGDEVAFENGSRFVVYDIFRDGRLCGCGYEYCSGRCASWTDIDPEIVKKTGRHFLRVAEVFEKMKEPE